MFDVRCSGFYGGQRNLSRTCAVSSVAFVLFLPFFELRAMRERKAMREIGARREIGER